MPEVRPERSGWRDERLSNMHRKWGFNCPMVDIDFFVYEYGDNKVAAAIEYKHENVKRSSIDLTKSNYCTIADHEEKTSTPFFVVRYKADLTAFNVIPANLTAKRKLAKERFMKEIEYVKFLYQLRGYECPQSIIDGLKIAV